MFKEYTSIENSYREKYINDFFTRHPEMRHKRYAVTEKIDGSNISFIFSRAEDGEIVFSYGKRSGLIAENENFFGIQAYIKSIEPFIEKVKSSLKGNTLFDYASTFTMFGEYFGPGIQKRIDYGQTKSIVFFDIMIDGVYVSQSFFFMVMHELLDPYGEFTIPFIKMAESFDEALRVNTHFNSLLGPDHDTLENECEGIVIKPWNERGAELLDAFGHPENFFVKVKNEKFAEMMKTKFKAPPEPQSAALTSAQELFASYLNENRIQSVFSKEGVISDTKDIGKYIKLIMEDAKKDFLKDEAEVFNSHELSDKERGKIFSIAGKIISKELMKYV